MRANRNVAAGQATLIDYKRIHRSTRFTSYGRGANGPALKQNLTRKPLTETSPARLSCPQLALSIMLNTRPKNLLRFNATISIVT